MFDPKYTITSKILSNIKQITVIMTVLNKKRFPSPILLELEKTAREVSSYASTSIEGNPLPLTEVKKILKNHPSRVRDTEREVINYNQVLEELQKKNYKINLELILKIHRGVTKGLLKIDNCGKLRKDSVFVNNPYTQKVIYLPPDYQDVLLLMKELLEYINNNHIDPILLAGIIHKQFVIIHPFVDGNGRTARLITKSLLALIGLNTFHLFSFENYYNENVTKYFQAVGVVGNYYDIKDAIDFTLWLEYFTDGIIDELLRVQKILLHTIKTPHEELRNYHKKIIDYIEENGYITDSQYASLVTRAKATRNIDFNNLIGRNIIERHGKGKNTFYKLK